MHVEAAPPPVVSQGTLRTREGESLPLLQTNVVARVDGVLANVVVTQTFKNTRRAPIEAIYSFPLPHDASVWRLEFRIADRIVKGVIKERAEARRAYQAAKAEGRAVTLLEEDAPAVFTLSVANVAPNAEIVVHLEYQEVLRYDDGRFVFVFPMVAPDLYRDGPAPDAADAVPPPRMLSPDRKADAQLEIRIAPTPVGTGPHSTLPVTEVHGRSHTVHPEVEPNGTTIVRVGGPGSGPIPNRDFVLEWQVASGGVQPVIRLEPAASAAGKGTFLLTLAPSRADAKVALKERSGEARPIVCGNCGAPVNDAKAIVEIAGFGTLVKCTHCGAMLAPATSPVIRASRARDVAILFDRSASMRASLPQARDVTMAVVDALQAGDSVFAMTFDHDRFVYDDQLRWVPAGPEVSQKIAAFFEAPARGGSDITKALEAIAKLPQREGRTRAVVLVTDGAVGNTAKLIRRVPEILGKSTRLYVLGVGPAVNRHFLETLARAGGGACTIVAPKDDARKIRDRFARKVIDGGPVLTDITLSWEGAGTSTKDMHPSPPPDLFGNEPIHIVGRYTGVGPSKLVVTANTPAGTPFRQEIEVTLPALAPRASDAPSLARIWARAEVKKLIEQGLNLDALKLALEHSLATPLTSLIAEDTEISVEKVQLPKGRLRVLRGQPAGNVFELAAGKTRLGRDASADIRLTSGNVSRMHAEITLDAKGYHLRDLSSTNGTIIDGAALREVTLKAPMTIRIGDTELVFEDVPGETIGILPTETVSVAEELVDDVVRVAAIRPARGVPPPRAAVPAPMPPPGAMRAPPAAPAMSLRSPDLAPPARGGFGPPPPARAVPAPGFAPPPMAAGYMPPPDDDVRTSARDVERTPPPRAAAGAPPMQAYAPPAASRPMMGRAPDMASRPYTPPAPVPARRATSTGAVSGSLKEVPLSELLLLFETSKKNGTLVVSSVTGGKGQIHLRGGLVGDAIIEGRYLHRIDAVVAMLSWRGNFELEPPNYREFAPADLVATADIFARAPAVIEPEDEEEHDTEPPPALGYHHGGPIPQAPARLVSGPAYPEAELTFVKHRVKGELDLAILVDATQSMGSHIAEVKARMNELLAAVAASPLCKSLRVALVSYRDHPPEDHSYISRVDLAFSTNVNDALTAVKKITAAGGGDGPEAVTDGLFDIVRLDWRPDAAKAVVWFGDAPPHGIGEHIDGFADGCPCGNDWFAQAESLREMGIAVYAMGCLPTIRQYVAAEQMYRTVARATHGMYLALHEAGMLVPLIAGAAEMTLDDQRIDEHVMDLVGTEPRALGDTTDDERIRWLLQGLHRREVQRRDLEDNGARLFRAVVERDVTASLSRLRAQSRVAW